jgi:WD40 repeat protein
VVALVAVGTAVVQRNHAAEQADRARAAGTDADVSRLVAQSEVLRTENPTVSTLLAVEAHGMRPDAETGGALLSAVVADPRHRRTLPTGSADNLWAMPTNGRVLVQHRGRLSVWDADSGRRVVRIPVARIETAAVRADGLIAAVGTDGRVDFFHPNGRPAGRGLATRHHGEYASAAFDGTGTRLVVGFGSWSDPRPVAASSAVTLVDVDTREVGPPVAGRIAGAMAVAFAPDGRTFAVGGADDRVVFRDAATGAETGPPIVVASPVDVIAFDPTRGRIAIGTAMTGVEVADVTTAARVPGLPDISNVAVPAYSPDGRFLAIGGSGPIRVFDAATLTELPSRASTHLGPGEPNGEPIVAPAATALARFLPDDRLVAGGVGAPVTVWDLRGTTVLDRVVPGARNYVFPMAGGRRIAAPDLYDSVTLHRAGSLATVGAPLSPGPGADVPVTEPATFAASYWDGSRIAVVNRSGVLQEYDAADHTPIGTTIRTGVTPIYAVYSRDMQHIAIGGRQGEVRVVDLRDHRVRALPGPTTNLVLGLEFGPHGDLFASDGGHVVRYDRATTSHPRLHDLSDAVTPNGYGMDLSPDGRLLAVSQGGSVAFFDALTLRPSGAPVPVSSNQIGWIAFDRTGRRLVTGDVANASRLVDVIGRRPIGPALGDDVAKTGSVFSHDGRTLGTWTFAGGALMSLDPAVWTRDACALAGRNLSPTEWAKYRPGTARHRTCPQYP